MAGSFYQAYDSRKPQRMQRNVFIWRLRFPFILRPVQNEGSGGPEIHLEDCRMFCSAKSRMNPGSIGDWHFAHFSGSFMVL